MIPETLQMLATDPLFPQRDILLDVSAVAQRLAVQLGTCGPLTVAHCERVRETYRFGDCLRVLHRMQVNGRWCVVAARMFPAGRSAEEYQKAAAVAVPCGRLRPVVHDAELHTVFWTFPNDRKISNLPLLMHIPPTLRPLLGPSWRRSQVVAYAPEKAATAQCLDDHGLTRAYAKVYAGTAGHVGYHNHHTLWRRLPMHDLHLRLPQAIAYAEAHCTLLLEPVMGPRLIDLSGTVLQHGLQRLGAALARFHALAPPEVPRFKGHDLETLRRAAHRVAQLRPDVCEAADALVQQLTSTWELPIEPPVCVHGDVHLKNGLLTEDRVTLIDLDEVALGPAAADLGSLLAELQYCGCVGVFPDDTAHALASSFLAGYATVRPLPPLTSLRWHTAAALLTERVLRAVKRLRLLGLQHLDALLANAAALLTGEGDVMLNRCAS